MGHFGSFCLILSVAEHIVSLCETPSSIPSINNKLLPNSPTLSLGGKRWASSLTAESADSYSTHKHEQFFGNYGAFLFSLPTLP